MKKRLQKYDVVIPAFLAIVVAIFSCGKQKPQVNNLNGNFKKYFNYQAGSYWLFYDSLSNNLDSLVVSAYTDKQESINVGTIDESVAIGMQEYSDSGIYYTPWALLLTEPYSAGLMVGAISSEVTYDLADNIPFRKGTFSDKSTNTSSTTNFLPSVTIGNITYESVYQISYRYSTPLFADTFYINSDKGFIAILLKNQSFHKRLFLNQSHIIH